MLKVNIHEAKTHLSRYARRVKAGERIILCDRNIPFAEFRPLSERDAGCRERPLGLDAGKVALSDDWDSPETNRATAKLMGLE